MRVKVVRVDWMDACSHPRWFAPGEDLGLDLGPVVTCGFFVSQNKRITNIGLLCDGEKFADVISIPTPSIKKITVLATYKID